MKISFEINSHLTLTYLCTWNLLNLRYLLLVNSLNAREKSSQKWIYTGTKTVKICMQAIIKQKNTLKNAYFGTLYIFVFQFLCCFRNGILLPKLFWTTVRKNCSSDRENILKFEAEDWEFAKFLRLWEQFIQTVKGL